MSLSQLSAMTAQLGEAKAEIEYLRTRNLGLAASLQALSEELLPYRLAAEAEQIRLAELQAQISDMAAEQDAQPVELAEPPASPQGGEPVAVAP